MNRPARSTYLALGDSYTAGEGVPESDRWCNQLVRTLTATRGITIHLDVIARTGWTTGELMDAVRSVSTETTYSFVTLLIGVNNQYRGLPLDLFRQEFSVLLMLATALARHFRERVFVLSIPDWSCTPFARTFDRTKIRSEIDAFNAAAYDECMSCGVTFIDVTELSRLAEHDRAMLTDDGLHYSGLMYEKWAQKLAPFVYALLPE